MLEHLRSHYPLIEDHYLAPGGGQVRQLSGSRVRRILRRFGETRSLGTEAGRTSRGTPGAARELVDSLNSFDIELADSDKRNELADVLQRWLIENPIAEFFAQQRLEVELDPRYPVVVKQVSVP